MVREGQRSQGRIAVGINEVGGGGGDAIVDAAE